MATWWRIMTVSPKELNGRSEPPHHRLEHVVTDPVDVSQPWEL